MTTADLVAWVKKHPLIAVCFVVVLIAGVGVHYLGASVEEATILLEQRTSEGTRISENVINSAQLREQAAEITAARAKIEERLVRSSELAKNLQYFYRLEAELGVELIDIKQNSSSANRAVPRGTKAGFSAVNFSVSFRGDYWAALHCLRRLENGTHFCRVLSASIEPISPDRAGPVKVALNLELLGHAQP
jgi:hypothetical protein